MITVDGEPASSAGPERGRSRRMSDTPLGEHALLSDCRSVALVTAGGSVDWLCWPRIDSPAVFGRLLDPDAGHFRIAPADGGVRRHVALPAVRPGVGDDVGSAPDGELEVVDALALGAHERGHDLGRQSPGVLLRRVRCCAGAVTVRVEFAPRPEFGLIHPRAEARPGHGRGRRRRDGPDAEHRRAAGDRRQARPRR